MHATRCAGSLQLQQMQGFLVALFHFEMLEFPRTLCAQLCSCGHQGQATAFIHRWIASFVPPHDAEACVCVRDALGCDVARPTLSMCWCATARGQAWCAARRILQCDGTSSPIPVHGQRVTARRVLARVYPGGTVVVSVCQPSCT